MKAWMGGVAAAVMLLLAGGWYVGSPWITLYNMKSAIERRDVEALIGYMDFDALRRNLKEQVHAIAAKQKQQREQANTSGWSVPDTMAAQVAAMDRQIDTFINAETVRTMAAKTGPARPGEFNDVGRMANEIAIDREGLGTFVVRAKKDTTGLGVIFTGHGMGWKVSGVRLPADAAQSMRNRPFAW